MSIAENVAEIKRRIAAVSGERPVRLVAASKMNSPERVREAIAAGVDACGENRVQELVEKREAGAYEGAPLHFIGHLQKNKVKYVVGAADLIESVDSLELLKLISGRAEKLGIIQDILLEVNIGGESAKSGFSPDELPLALEFLSKLPAVKARGLMAIPPISVFPGSNRPYFARMRQLVVDIEAKKYDNVNMDFLSMGMSGDFEDAIMEGANMVRVGSAIFGQRDYSFSAPADTGE